MHRLCSCLRRAYIVPEPDDAHWALENVPAVCRRRVAFPRHVFTGSCTSSTPIPLLFRPRVSCPTSLEAPAHRAGYSPDTEDLSPIYLRVIHYSSSPSSIQSTSTHEVELRNLDRGEGKACVDEEEEDVWPILGLNRHWAWQAKRWPGEVGSAGRYWGCEEQRGSTRWQVAIPKALYLDTRADVGVRATVPVISWIEDLGDCVGFDLGVSTSALAVSGGNNIASSATALAGRQRRVLRGRRCEVREHSDTSRGQHSALACSWTSVDD
ncbi:unnamed protein product [Cyclocybe aegerita]|uniref:Uncharacterized protein n=1 Tax=Cyclocybe aegerita TaxID=1973307 RepID=A0A8S0X0W7_CYCAE|nr:unnamed protein product [Cyclocybe aegerita]